MTIPPKTILVTITVRVGGDVEFEGDETFFVNLSNPNGATLADAQGVGTIENDETTAVLLSMFETATVSRRHRAALAVLGCERHHLDVGRASADDVGPVDANRGGSLGPTA